MGKKKIIRRSYPLPPRAPPAPPSWVFPVPWFPFRVAATLIDWGLGGLMVWGAFFAWTSLHVFLTSRGILHSGVPGFWDAVGFILAGFLLYFGVCYEMYGTTPGKAVFSLRLEHAKTRARVGFGRAFLRECLLKALPLFAAACVSQTETASRWLPAGWVLVPCLPVLHALFMGFFRSDGRLLTDLLVGTRVVAAPKSRTWLAWATGLTSRRALSFQALCLLSLCAARYGTRLSTALMQSSDLYHRFKPAIVRIEVFQGSTPVAEGSGFFISGDGQLLTNDHVLARVLREGYSARFHLADGTSVDEWEFGQCSDRRNIDLCLIRLPVLPPVWFRPKRTPIAIGDEALVIGHPQGYEFSFSVGVVSGLRKQWPSFGQTNFLPGATTGRLDWVQFTSSIAPGSSGGPVFNREGELLAVVTGMHKDSWGLNFGVDGAEAFAFVSRNTRWTDSEGAKRDLKNKVYAEEKRIQREIYDPANAAMEKKEGLDLAYFRPAHIDLENRLYRFWMPREFAGQPGQNVCEDLGTPKDKGPWGVNCGDKKYDRGHIRIEYGAAPVGYLRRQLAGTGLKDAIPMPSLELVHPRREACEERMFQGPQGGPGLICWQVQRSNSEPDLETWIVTAQADAERWILAATSRVSAAFPRVHFTAGALVVARSLEITARPSPVKTADRSLASETSFPSLR